MKRARKEVGLYRERRERSNDSCVSKEGGRVREGI